MHISKRIQNYLIKSGKRDSKPQKPDKSEDENWVIGEPTLGELWLEWFDKNRIKLAFISMAVILIWLVTFMWALAVVTDWNRCHLSKECRQWMITGAR